MIKIKTTTLFDFDETKIAEENLRKEEDRKIMDLLSRFSAQMILEFLKHSGGHPEPEWGDGESWRFYYLNECSRRGLKLLEDLGWPTNEDDLYVNIYTGHVDTLQYAALFPSRTGEPIANKVWSVIEHWEPYYPDIPNKFRIAYLKKQLIRLEKVKLKKNKNSYDKSDIKKIPEIEKEIQIEESKRIGDKTASIKIS